MATFYIAYGADVGGTHYDMIDASSEDEAINIAYEMALEWFDSYAGLHGVPDEQSFMEDDGMTEEEAAEAYHQVREFAVDYFICTQEEYEENT